MLLKEGDYVKIIRKGYSGKTTISHLVRHDRGEPYSYLLHGDFAEREWDEGDLELLDPQDQTMIDDRNSRLSLDITLWDTYGKALLYLECPDQSPAEFWVGKDQKEEFISLLENMIVLMRGLQDQE